MSLGVSSAVPMRLWLGMRMQEDAGSPWWLLITVMPRGLQRWIFRYLGLSRVSRKNVACLFCGAPKSTGVLFFHWGSSERSKTHPPLPLSR